ncbi:MraY family glycosyltransferase [Piscinibacter terrae]|uniref:Glycosyl transferase n=1 Tax=Piscinibacter terrae TaxID=2496871 RepID=A0A3N7JJW4_9BURK|nr:glycosyltransferase [Albitalea terrae]RQP21629.1 glycosyl transferase [Albitalea terrae]
MLVLFCGFLVSTLITFVVVRFANAHGHLSGDNDMSGPQKFHARPVPRIGGLGIVLGVSASILVLWLRMGAEAVGGPLIMLAGMPAFLAGLAEDLTKTQSPRRRLFFTAVSAALAGWLLDAVIRRTDIPGVDWIITFTPAAMILTVFAVAGVANAINIIDGFNGLAGMCVVLMLGGLAYVAFQAKDPMLAWWALGGVGAVLGFFIWNFPAGLIFLGDGGAYFLGFLVAELSLLLIHRNPQVSPLCPLLMCIYPIFETVFSIYRRRFVRGRPIGMPDGVHLHSLIYRRLMRWAVGNRNAKVLTKRNSLTAPYLWMLCMMSVVPALFFWNNSHLLALFIVLFAGTYTVLYGRIVKFKVPRWMIVRR